MPTFRLTIAYDGTGFVGWQRQAAGTSIQGLLEDALGALDGRAVVVTGAGRTDAGVHALAQVASFQSASTIPLENFVKALNSLLPESIRVLSAEEVPADFHARHCAKAKTYEYRIYRGSICPPFLAKYVNHHPYPLDEEAMNQAAALVIGEHDFTSFAAVDPERNQENCKVERDNHRTMYSSQWERRGEELVYTVRGDGCIFRLKT